MLEISSSSNEHQITRTNLEMIILLCIYESERRFKPWQSLKVEFAFGKSKVSEPT